LCERHSNLRVGRRQDCKWGRARKERKGGGDVLRISGGLQLASIAGSRFAKKLEDVQIHWISVGEQPVEPMAATAALSYIYS
jgi:hypothetical protein